MSKNIIFFLAFLFAGFVFLAHYWIVGSGVWGDGRYYYSYVRSLVIDGNLDFRNELAFFSEPIRLTKTGIASNKYAVGPALFWLPFFGIAHLLIRGDGYSHLYQILVGLGGVVYGVVGLYLCFRVCQNWFGRKIALIAVFGIWLASNLFFYTAVDPINSHSVSFFVAALLIFLWQKFWSEKDIAHLVVLGILTGVLGAIRTQDLIFVLPILVWVKNPFILGGLFLGFLPQLIVWQFLYGEIRSPYLFSGEKFNWLNPQVFPVLFSQNNGLFVYSPILIFSLFGFYFFYKKNPFLSISAIILFLFQTYVVSSWHIWWGGAAYGGRMFISLMPFFIIGLASFINQLREKQKIVYGLIFLLIILNFGSMIKFLLVNP